MRLGSDWRRLHPLSPLLRAGRFVVVAAAVLFDEVATGLDLRPRLVLLLLGAALGAGAAAGWWSWANTGYRITSEDVELSTGLFFRRHRRVPLARLESVDIARPLAARLFGLAQLRLEAVSGSKTEVRLSYLDYDAALGVRDELRGRLEGPMPTAPTPPAGAAPLVRVPTGELVLGSIASAVTSGAPVLLPAVLAILVVIGPVLAILLGIMAIVVPVLAGLLEAERHYGFTLRPGTDGLEIRRGLLNEMYQRVPIDRIQALGVVEPLLWRPYGRARLVVDVAGYRGGAQDERQRASVLLPVAPLPVVADVLQRVQPGLHLDDLRHTPVPVAARWRAPLWWRAYSVAWDGQHAVMRRGLLRRRTEIVPHRKVQSLRVTQGPWQRALGLATLHLDTAGAEIRARAPHRDRDEAERLAWASRASAGVRLGRVPSTAPAPRRSQAE